MRGNEVRKTIKRLDTGVVNSSFLTSFPSIYEAHIAKNSFYHLPILFKFLGLGNVAKPLSKLFGFQNLWLMHESCAYVVKSSWDISIDLDMGVWLLELQVVGINLQPGIVRRLAIYRGCCMQRRNKLKAYYAVLI